MGFWNRWTGRRAEGDTDPNQACEALRQQIADAMGELMTAFTDRGHFIDPAFPARWAERHRGLLTEACADEILRLKRAASYHVLAAEYYDLRQSARILTQETAQHNQLLAKKCADGAARLIGPVEGHMLDPQQLECIAREAENHLVLAGAGTGKTTTILGKIKYLLASGACKPDELLVLSFTNASAAEMTQRIQAETGIRIDASTFHSLGLSILRQTDGAAPKLTGLNLRSFVREQLEQQMKNRDYLAVLTTYLLYYRTPSKSMFSFRSQRSYEEYRMHYPPKTVKNQTVRHYGEMDIANFLTQNGIDYRYDYAYAFDPKTPEYGPYRPSFYLQKHHIYIEYWPVNRSWQPPAYFPSKNGKRAVQACQEEIRWKRSLHETNHTTLIECYAYEKAEGTLLTNLKQKLEAHGVACRPVSAGALWKTLSKDGPGILDSMTGLMETMLTLLKSNEESVDAVRLRNRGSPSEMVNEMLLELAEPIYDAY